MAAIARRLRLHLKRDMHGILALQRALLGCGYPARLVQRTSEGVSQPSWLSLEPSTRRHETLIAIGIEDELFNFSSGVAQGWGPLLFDRHQWFFPRSQAMSCTFFSDQEQLCRAADEPINPSAGFVGRIMDAIKGAKEEARKYPVPRAMIPTQATTGNEMHENDDDQLFHAMHQYRLRQPSIPPRALLCAVWELIGREYEDARILKRNIQYAGHGGVLSNERIAIEYGTPKRLICLNAQSGWNRLSPDEHAQFGVDELAGAVMGEVEDISKQMAEFQCSTSRPPNFEPLLSFMQSHLLRSRTGQTPTIAGARRSL
jgi:hypothetical protein